MGNLVELSYTEEKIEGAASFIVGATEFFIPVGTDAIDVEQEIARLEKDLDYARGFLKSVMAKLSNERFVSSAPPKVVDLERKKQADTESKISVIEAQLKALRAKT